MTSDTQRGSGEAARISRAWQDGVQAVAGGYAEQWQRWQQMTAEFWGLRWLDRDRVRENVRRIAEGTREVATAQAAVTGEWLRAPLWLTGAGSPADLQARYFQLVEARRELTRAYLDAALDLQHAIGGATEHAVEQARESVDAQVQTARRVANDTRDVQQGAVAAVRDTAAGARQVAERVVEQAGDVAEEAAERADLVQRPVKGNINSRGEKIYHLPGQSSYERVQPEETFATEAAAQAAGYRRAQTPGGGAIKGKIGRDGEKIYHLPGQANYERIDEPDMLFETEEAARGAGFRPAQR